MVKKYGRRKYTRSYRRRSNRRSTYKKVKRMMYNKSYKGKAKKYNKSLMSVMI